MSILHKSLGSSVVVLIAALSIGTTSSLKEKNRLHILFFLVLTALLLIGCISSTSFQKWSGPSEFRGQGGTFRRVGGID